MKYAPFLSALPLLITLLSCKAEKKTIPEEPTQEQSLVKEFKSSYSEDTPKSTGIRWLGCPEWMEKTIRKRRWPE